MALITCPECKYQVSEHASVCPQCGYKLNKIVAALLKYSENKSSTSNINMSFKRSIVFVVVLVAICIVMVKIYIHFFDRHEPPKLSQVKATQEPTPEKINVMTHVETKKEYISTAKTIGDKKDSIYLKDFIKDPDKYKFVRVKISVKVTEITETNGKSFLNVALTRKYDPGIIFYDGSLHIYDGDIIEVYGEVYGRYEGRNRMGATLSWPAINAKYIKKIGTDHNE